jgi:colanic acid/amylovoran biosynthesis glycosyltransferase
MTSGHRALAFLACPPAHFGQLTRCLRAAAPDARWDFVCLYPPPHDPGAGVRVLRPAGRARFALGLVAGSLVRPYRSVWIAVEDLRRTEAVMPLVALSLLLRAGARTLIDRAGARRPVAAAWRAPAALLVAGALLPLARAVTSVGLRLASPRPPAARDGAVALLIPILPDLSHTFVYREALELLKVHPEWQALVLETGDAGVVHREAAELGRRATVVPALGPARYLLAYLRHWLVRPRAMAGLIRFFQPHTASFGPGATPDDATAFLRLEYLQHSNYLARGLMLAEWLRRHRIGYVHVWGTTYPAVRALVAHRLLGVRLSLSTFVDFDYATPFHMLDDKLAAARFVTTCSAFCAARLGARFPALAPRLHVLRPSVAAGYTAGKALRPRDGRSRVVFVGRFVAKKGLDTLLRACARLVARGLVVDCRLYGGGEEEERLRALAGGLGLDSVVRFEGPVPNERFYETLNHDDVFVVPSRLMPDGDRDGIPVVLIEAMAAGLTVVSTPVSGIPELVEHGESGYLVAPDDPAALAALLEMLLATPAARERVAAAARRTVSERFALEAAGERLAGWISRESACGG